MKYRALLIIYLIVWVGIAAGIIYFITRADYPWWLGFIGGYLLFIFVNGTYAYRGISHQYKHEGREPPSYLKYIFFPKGFSEYRKEAPKPMRIIVGIATIVCGIPMIALAVLSITATNFIETPDSLGLLLITALAACGGVFLYVGIRMITYKGKSLEDAT